MSTMTTSTFLLLPNFQFPSSPTKTKLHNVSLSTKPITNSTTPLLFKPQKRPGPIMVHCTPTSDSDLDCAGTGTGTDVEFLVPEDSNSLLQPSSFDIESKAKQEEKDGVSKILEWLLLVSPFFFWGTAMVAMKGVIPKTGPFFVASFRLIPAGALLVGFAAAKGRPQPAGVLAWVSIGLFALVDAACFQVGRR